MLRQPDQFCLDCILQALLENKAHACKEGQLKSTAYACKTDTAHKGSTAI